MCWCMHDLKLQWLFVFQTIKQIFRRASNLDRLGQWLVVVHYYYIAQQPSHKAICSNNDEMQINFKHLKYVIYIVCQIKGWLIFEFEMKKSNWCVCKSEKCDFIHLLCKWEQIKGCVWFFESFKIFCKDLSFEFHQQKQNMKMHTYTQIRWSQTQQFKNNAQSNRY